MQRPIRQQYRAMGRIGIQGFTLAEVMIVLVIIAILTAIALPSYQETMIKNRRADAKIALTAAAARQERYFTENNGYTTNVNDIGGSSGTLKSPEEHYVITISNTDCGDNTCYMLTAAPQGQQTKDACGSLTLKHSGIKGKTGVGNLCW